MMKRYLILRSGEGRLSVWTENPETGEQKPLSIREIRIPPLPDWSRDWTGAREEARWALALLLDFLGSEKEAAGYLADFMNVAMPAFGVEEAVLTGPEIREILAEIDRARV
jgi:hypothetical protein